MTSSPAGVSPGPRPISRTAVRSAASRSARQTAAGTLMSTRAERTGPRRRFATPVLAEAGTAVAARAGGAVRAAAWADSRGSGMVGSPARAAWPGGEVGAPGRFPPGPAVSSMVRMATLFTLEDHGEHRRLGTPRPGPSTRWRRGAAPWGGNRPTIHRAEWIRGSNLCGASHAQVWRDVAQKGGLG